MSGYTPDQLAEQKVLIRRFYAKDLSHSEFDDAMAAIKAEQDIVNAAQQAVYDARRVLDVWLGGDYQKQIYAGSNSTCQSAGVRAAKSGGSYTEAFNKKWKEIDSECKKATAAKREELQSCQTVAEITALSRKWEGPKISQDDSGAAQAVPTEPKQEVFKQPVPVIPKPVGIEWEVSGGGIFLNARRGIPDGINRLVIINRQGERFEVRAFTKAGIEWQASFPGLSWDPSSAQHPDGHRWDGHISQEQYEMIKANGRL